MPFIARSFVRVERLAVAARSAIDYGEARVSDVISPPWSPKSTRIPGDWISVSITPPAAPTTSSSSTFSRKSYSSYFL
jgi:hypothetical protein